MPLCDSHHRENGRGDGIFAEDMPADFADVARADDFFHLQHFHKYGLQAMTAELPPLPECVVCFGFHGFLDIVFYDIVFHQEGLAEDNI